MKTSNKQKELLKSIITKKNLTIHIDKCTNPYKHIHTYNYTYIQINTCIHTYATIMLCDTVPGET